MNTIRVELLQFNPANLRKSATNTPLIAPINSRFKPYSSPSSKSSNTSKRSNETRNETIEKLAASLKSKARSSGGGGVIWRENSRAVVLGAASVGIALLLMGFDGEKAMALGPEGPLMEEFWDNMRRYGLYALTVSSGAIWALLEPIVELLKNPISALLVVIIFGGGFFIVSQVVTAMVGLSDFSYEYNY